MPDPEPVAPETMVSHDAELDAVHGQPAPFVTAIVRLLVAADGSETLVGDTLALQTGAACVTEKTRPPMVIVAVRGVVPVFAVIA